MSGPVPGTPTPWGFGRRSKHRLCIDGQGWFELAKVVVRIRGHDDDTEEGLANAAAIVHRVNNWDALEAERDALKARVDALVEASASVIAQAFDYYTARNGKRCSIEGDDGEKCWIVPFDAFEHLRAALAKGEQP